MLRTIPASRVFALILSLIMLLASLLPAMAADPPDVAVSLEDYSFTNASPQVADPSDFENQAAFLAKDDAPGVISEASTLAADEVTVYPDLGINVASLDLDPLLETLAAGYVDNSDGWEIMTMSAYSRYQPGSPAKPSAIARQSYINSAISVLGDVTSGIGDFAKAIITLQSLGADPKQLYPVNSLTPFNAFDLLETAVDSADFTYLTTTLPYVLEAFRQSGTTNDSEREQLIKDFLLSAQEGGAGWGWGPGAADEDTTAMVIASLAPYYTEPAVKSAIDTALAWLSGQQQADGAFGSTYEGFTYYNASSTAQVIIALCTLGLDPDQNDFFPYSALSGLLSFLTVEFDGFAGGDWEAQGFRALIAAAQFYQNGGAFDVYDFSAVATAPARATGAGKAPSVSAPPSTNPDITVAVTIKTDDRYWMEAKQVIVKEGSSVYHAVTAALPGSGITVDGAESGYIKSIAYNGVTLAEFSKGSGSGWLYKVNDTLPNVSILAHLLQDNDRIVVYFTEDWTKDPDAGAFKSGGGSGDPETAESKPTTDVGVIGTPALVDNNGKATATVTENEMQTAVANAWQAFEQAKASGDTGVTPVVVIEVQTPEEREFPVTAVEVSIPAAVFAYLAEVETVGLIIKSETATITFSNAALLGLFTTGDGAALKISVSIANPESVLNAAQMESAGDKFVISLEALLGDTPASGFAGTVTVSAPYPLPENIPAGDYDLLTVYYLDVGGVCTELKGAAYNPETGLITFTTTHFSVFFVSEWLNPFSDVGHGDWCYRSVRYTYTNGLMNGTDATVFAPETKLSRAMLVCILARQAGCDANGGVTWYSGAVDWGKAAGITDGLNPDGEITREQFVTMLYRFAQYKGLNVSANSYSAAYVDAARTSDWATEAMSWAIANGLISGRTESTLVPDGSVSRAEAAAIIQIFMENIAPIGGDI